MVFNGKQLGKWDYPAIVEAMGNLLSEFAQRIAVNINKATAEAKQAAVVVVPDTLQASVAGKVTEVAKKPAPSNVHDAFSTAKNMVEIVEKFTDKTKEYSINLLPATVSKAKAKKRAESQSIIDSQ